MIVSLPASWPWRIKRTPRAFTALLLTVLLLLAPAAARAAGPSVRSAAPAPATYSNPVIPQNAPDPAIIKALDGYYYLIASTDYWQDGTYHILPIFRSLDLVNWRFVGDSFATKPAWIGQFPGLFAPDLQYYNHKYYMYYNASDTVAGGSAIGVATADTPAGPWTDAGAPLVPPRACTFNTDPGCRFWTFDPAEFTDQDGQKYLYFGSYFGGTLVITLTVDGLHTSGAPIQIGHWDRYEGTYVVRHGAYYYNFSSAANCCAGPNTGYSVEVNRSTSPMGPFVDQNGFEMERPGAGQPDPAPAPTVRPSFDPSGENVGAQGGGYPTLKQNGNKWHGVGHNALITDLSGHEWIVYHGVDSTPGQSWINTAPIQITNRQVMIDRVDWTGDGWPVVNGGAGPSETNAAPVTTPIFGANFNTPGGCAAPGSGARLDADFRVLRGAWTINPGTCTTGAYAEQSATTADGLIVSRTATPDGYRAECDVRLEAAGSGGRYGCVTSYRAGSYVAVVLDPARNALVTQPYLLGRPVLGAVVTPLPAGFDHSDWHHLAIDEVASTPRGVTFRVTVSDRNRDPLASQTRPLGLPGFFWRSGGVGFITTHAHADFDNLTAAPLNQATVPTPQMPPIGAIQPPYSDEFNSALGTQWSWVREDPTKHALASGQLSITVNGDLYRQFNTATNLLVEAAPAGNYAVETRITFDPRDNYQQAGLLIYSDDDHYIKVGPAHLDSLNKMVSGHESLEPLPANVSSCDGQPLPGSNVAVTTYTRDLCPNEGEGWDYLTNAQPVANGITAARPAVTDWLRIYRSGNVYTPYTSVDNVHWVKGTAWSMTAVDSAHPVNIGLFAFSAGNSNDIPALFDYVRVYSQP